MWLEAKKRVKYIWVFEIMTYKWVGKRYARLNMFSAYGEQIHSLISKPSKLNFCNQPNPFCCCWHNASWQLNHTLLTLSVTAFLNMDFWGPSLRVVRIFLNLQWYVFPTRESTLGLTGWTLLFQSFWWPLHGCLLHSLVKHCVGTTMNI